jgi:hypothetical protein
MKRRFINFKDKHVPWKYGGLGNPHEKWAD